MTAIACRHARKGAGSTLTRGAVLSSNPDSAGIIQEPSSAIAAPIGDSYQLLFVIERWRGSQQYLPNLERAIGRHLRVHATFLAIDPPVNAGWGIRWRVSRWSQQYQANATFLHLEAVGLLSWLVTARIPTVISLDSTAASRRSGLRRRATALVGRWGPTGRVYRATAALVAWSHWTARSLITDYGVNPERVHVIPPGIDLERYTPATWRSPDQPVRMLMVAENFVRQRGPDVLAALGSLSGRASLDVVTESEVGPIQSGLSCRVHRGIGPDSRALIDLYQQADIFLQPFSDQRSSTAVAQALGCGLPVVATSTGALPEMVHDGLNGLLVPAGEPSRLGAALMALTESPELRREMGARSLEVARREHDADVNGDRLLQVMVEAAASRAQQAVAQ